MKWISRYKRTIECIERQKYGFTCNSVYRKLKSISIQSAMTLSNLKCLSNIKA